MTDTVFVDKQTVIEATWLNDVNAKTYHDDASLLPYTPAGTGAVARTVDAKLGEVVSVKDFGAVGDGVTDATTGIQAAIDAVNAAGGGIVKIPTGVFRVTQALILYSDISIIGDGKASALHLVTTARTGLLQAIGTQIAPLSRITIRDLSLVGDAVFSGGTPSVINGGGIDFQFTDDCVIDAVWVSGFSDGGIAFINGNYNCISNCRVRYTAQNISFTANTIDVYGNVMTNNVCTDTGTYNGLHLEGSFGAGLGDGKVFGTVIANNVVHTIRECGINIELAPNTVCSGNTVIAAGYAGTAVNMGIKLFGSYQSSVVGNIVKDATGYGIVIGADSGNSTISGNTTINNTNGSLLLTDNSTTATLNVTISSNNFNEGDFITSGNVSINTKMYGIVKFANVANSDTTTLDWYEEGSFTPTSIGSTTPGAVTYTLQDGKFTRIGNTVFFWLAVGWSSHTGTGNLQIAGLPYAANGSILRTVTCWTNGLAVPAGQIMQASIPQGGVSYINIQTYADNSGAAAAIAVDSNVPTLILSGAYQV